LAAIFIASSFFPVIQIYILTFDGAFVSLANKAFGSDNPGNIMTANIVANLLPTIFLLFVFFKATKRSIKIITATLAMIFMTAFIFFITDGLIEDGDPYFLNFIIVSIISGTVLTLVGVFKYFTVQRRKTLD
jgi:hypothetical protein